MNPLLSIKNLNVSYGKTQVVSNASLKILEKETIGLIGKSGSSKTTIALSIMGLLPEDATATGEIIYKEKNLLTLKEKEINKIRGCEIAMIFQDPVSVLDPLFSIKEQIKETITAHLDISKKEVEKRIEDLLKKVGIQKIRLNEYPHSFSGGMAQRIMIAQAISSNPKLLIADEPTSSLDVTIQSQIMNLLHSLKSELEISILLITHDLSIIAQMADYVYVIYSGEIIESASCLEIFDNPSHPYTKALIDSIPKKGKDLSFIEDTQILEDKPCRFYSRCKEKISLCEKEKPEIKKIENHYVRCHKY
ncbi:MAG: ABC transporter ATP-binding protein [bacterium]